MNVSDFAGFESRIEYLTTNFNDQHILQKSRIKKLAKPETVTGQCDTCISDRLKFPVEEISAKSLDGQTGAEETLRKQGPGRPPSKEITF